MLSEIIRAVERFSAIVPVRLDSASPRRSWGRVSDPRRRNGGVRRDPDVLDARVQILIENQRFDDACQAIEQGLQECRNARFWQQVAIPLFSRCGADAKAIEAARSGVEIYPGAYLWLLFGQTLNEMRQFAEVGEIESCLRQSAAQRQPLRDRGPAFHPARRTTAL